MHGAGWDHMNGWGWAGMLLMTLVWFAFVVLIVWALIGWRDGRGPVAPSGPAGDPAMTILRERFARGEIAADEFERARETLETRS